MIILGIDTAIRCTGYGVIKMNTINDIEIIDCGVIKNAQKLRHSECLRRLAGGTRELIKAYEPHSVSIEDAFYCKNVKTAMILSLARGAVITATAEADLPIYTYSPKTAKRAAVGMGQASKQQVAIMMAAMFKIDISQIPDDATDALAIAICHGQLAMRKELDLAEKNRI